MGLLAAVGFVWDVERGSSLTQKQRATVVGSPTRKSRAPKNSNNKKDGTSSRVGTSSSSSSAVVSTPLPAAMLSSRMGGLDGAAAGLGNAGNYGGLLEGSVPSAAALITSARTRAHIGPPAATITAARQTGGRGEPGGVPEFGNQPSQQQQLQNQWTSLLQMPPAGAARSTSDAAAGHQPQGLLNQQLLLRLGLQHTAPGTSAAAADLPASISFPTEPVASLNSHAGAPLAEDAPHQSLLNANNNAYRSSLSGGAMMSPLQALQAAQAALGGGLDLSTIAASMAAAQAQQQQQQQNPYQWLSNMSAVPQIPLPQQQPQAGSAAVPPQYVYFMPPAAVQHPFGAAAATNPLLVLLSGTMAAPPQVVAPTVNVANLAQLLAGTAGTTPTAGVGGNTSSNAQLQNMASALLSSAMAGNTPGVATAPYSLAAPSFAAAAAAAAAQAPQGTAGTPDLLAAWTAALGATAAAQPPGIVAPVGVLPTPAVQAGANNTTGTAGAAGSVWSPAEATRYILGSTQSVAAAGSRTQVGAPGSYLGPSLAAALNNATSRNSATTAAVTTSSGTDPPADAPDDDGDDE